MTREMIVLNPNPFGRHFFTKDVPLFKWMHYTIEGSLSSVIVWVSVVLKRTVVVNVD